jgi:hypothetical protein
MILVLFVLTISLALVAIGMAAEALIERFDSRRVGSSLAKRGCRVVEMDFISHEGWRSRLYRVVYVDAAGYPHCATCEASCIAGVSWGRDRVIGSPFLA